MGAEGRHSFRAVPHCGERPSPHQETEADTSARNTTRSYSNTMQGILRKFCRLTPPVTAGSSHRQTAGGGGQNLVLKGRCELSEIFKEHTVFMKFSPSCLPHVGVSDRPCRRMPGHLTLASSVEKNTNENEFQCQLKFQFFPLLFEKKFQILFIRPIILINITYYNMLTYYHIPLIKSYSKQRTAMHKVSRGLILWSPAESSFSDSGNTSLLDSALHSCGLSHLSGKRQHISSCEGLTSTLSRPSA